MRSYTLHQLGLNDLFAQLNPGGEFIRGKTVYNLNLYQDN